MLHASSDLTGIASLWLPHRIWQVLPDLVTGQLLVAVRDGEARTVGIWVFDPAEGKGRTLKEGLDWWTQVAGACRDVLLLSSYPEPSSPRMGGIRALQISTGAKLWEREDVQFREVHARGVVVLDEGGDPALLDLENGKALGEDTQADSDWKDLVERKLQYPRWYHAGEPEFEAWRETSGAKGQAICGWADGRKGAYAWHEQGEDGSWRLELKVGERQLSLEKGMKAWHPEPFFVLDGRVVSIRDQQELLVIAF